MNTTLESKITIESLQKAYANNNFAFFEKDAVDFNLNIFGVRSKVYDTNTFNDVVGLAWKYNGEWTLKKYAATTDPGLYYFANPINQKGTHIMKEGQYRGAYATGKHQGKYGALIQVGPVDFYTDNDRDLVFDKTLVERGIYIGANIHSVINSSIPDLLAAPLSYFPNKESSVVHKWSAACQVLANPRKYLEFMTYVYSSAKALGNKFTYTLFEETSF